MNRKQFITLLVLGLVIGGLGIYLYNQRKESYGTSYFQSGQRVIPDFPVNEVAHLRIQTATNEVNLVRGEDNAWTVQERWDYPASFPAVSGFLRTVWQLEPVQDVQAGPSQYGRLDLVSPEKGGTNTATLIEFKDAKGANLKSLLLGKNHSRESSGGPFGGGGSFPVGRYILVPGTEKVWLVSETFSDISTNPEQWLNKDFIKVEKVKSITLDRPESETNSWKVARETEGGTWQLADPNPGENFDSSKASSLNYAFSSPSFNDVVSPEADPAQTGLDEPITARLETFEGFTYTVRVGAETNGNYYIQVDVQADLPTERTPAEDEKPEDKEAAEKSFQENLTRLKEKLQNEQRHAQWTYLVSKFTVDSLLKDRGDFMSEPKEDAAPETTEEGHEGHDHSSTGLAPGLNLLPPALRDIPQVSASNIPPKPAADSTPKVDAEQEHGPDAEATSDNL